MTPPPISLSLGPLLFNWPADRIRDFYRRIADEAPINDVYLGEVVCGKRQPLLQGALADAAERLESAGLRIIWSTYALPATPRERRLTAELAQGNGLLEANDMSAILDRSPAPFVAGPLLNIYSGPAAAELVGRGCVRICPNIELSLAAISSISRDCPGVEIELFGFGRAPLAISGRCAQARFAGLHKDSCRYVCDQHPDGMTVSTFEEAPFLAVNGVQTLSHGVQTIDVPVTALRAAGVTNVRLSPHAMDMVAVSRAFRDYLDGAISHDELQHRLRVAGPPGPLVSGYLHGAPGMMAALA